MGLSIPIVEALVREHLHKALRGDALFIGRQTVYFTKPNILRLLQENGINPAIDPADIEIDMSTGIRSKDYANEELITDASLMKLFGVTRTLALDHSPWEKADLIHDLRYPLPDNLCESADVLIDGSTLDNVFTPSTVLQNYARLLRPGGRMFLVNAYSAFESSYVIMPPMWYVDYFVMNRFADCRVYVLLYLDSRRNAFYVDLNDVHRLGISMGFFPNIHLASVIVFAEKGEFSTCDRLPIQQHYREADDWETYNNNLSMMLTSKRAQLVRSNSDPFIPTVQGGYQYINSEFVADNDAFHRQSRTAATDQTPEATRGLRGYLSRFRRAWASATST